ncbi:MAG: sensor histidine kinase [Flavobacterium sp.]|uniref:tetratricopeptide repeat-containing sensor histidine kinase n=1 Tax=Flavobacterium sp. TaxID=239 RepID=UPI00261478D0|nr:sensor histidine kinase [Flavobacterium sp.]MDD5150485.1 sensor histidine kinase [Flavobacterium sp.]
MKKLHWILILFLLSKSIYSQRFNSLNDKSQFIDSITTIIKTTKNDSLKCIYSYKIGGLYLRNKDTSNFYAYLQLGNSLSNKYPYLKDLSGYFNALDFYIKGDVERYAKEITITLNKIKKYKHISSYEMQAILAQNLSLVRQMQDNEKESMRLIVEVAIPAAIQSKNSEILSDQYKLVAIALMNILDREKANSYFRKAIVEIEKANTSSPILLETKIELYIVAAENLIYLKNYSEGRDLLNKAFLILKNYPTSNLNGLYYYSDGLYYQKLKKYQLALKSYKKGIEVSQYNNDLYSINRCKFVRYQTYFEQKKYAEANAILLELIKNGKLLAQEKKDYYKEASTTYYKLGDYKNAFKYIEKYTVMNDSIIQSQSKNQVLLLEAKFNKVENEKKIKELEHHNRNAILAAENTRLYIILISLLSFVLLLSVYFLWRNSRTQKQLTVEKEINYNQSISFLKNQKENEVMQAMINGEEIERKRIARDLHDGIGSRLSALKMKLSQSSFDNFEDISQMLNNAIIELRQVSFNLLPETLLKLGLELALKDLCHSLETNKVTINFISNEIQKTISESNQITIFRIIQELINNALKHSNCTEIIVECSQNGNLFLITVEDNGVGFNSGNIENFSGLGLKNIKNRIVLMKGKLSIDSSKNSVTSINIELILD